MSAITLPGLIGEPLALDLMLTGRRVEAQEALQLGLVGKLAAPLCRSPRPRPRPPASRKLPRAVALTKPHILADRKQRIRDIGPEIDRARLAVTDSDEYADVVKNKPGTGRARS